MLRDKCGTTAGWNQHEREGEAQCAPCLGAKAKYQREWRLRTGRTKYKLVRLTETEGEAA